MSITINNHLSNSIQDTRATSAEKLGQKGKTAEVGKTQESSISANLDQVNMGEDGVAITEVSRQQRPEAQKRPAVPHTDRVEISAEGQAASAKIQKQQADTKVAGGKRYETEDLSAYTATELKQMYYRGEITRQEYEEETGKMLE